MNGVLDMAAEPSFEEPNVLPPFHFGYVLSGSTPPRLHPKHAG